MVEEKKCLSCGIVKPSKDFPKRANKKDGLYCYCYACHREKIKARYQYHKAQKQKLYEDLREWTKDIPVR